MGDFSREKLIQGTRKLTRDWGREIKLGSGVLSIYRFHTKEGISRRHPGFIEYAKSATQFSTRSTYEGNYNSLGFAGYGEYIYPHGVKYEGKFKDGMFHGKGTLIYPVGQRIEGIWKKGKLIKYVFRFGDNLEYSSPWKYCQQPDRRFQSEKNYDLHPAGDEFLTDRQPSKVLKQGCYDTVDGYFDPKTKCVYKDEHIYLKDGKKTYYCRQNPDVLRVCTKKEEGLIRKHYRKTEDESVGYKPGLYEVWTTGCNAELEKTKNKLKESEPPEIVRTLSSAAISLSDTSSSNSSI